MQLRIERGVKNCKKFFNIYVDGKQNYNCNQIDSTIAQMVGCDNWTYNEDNTVTWSCGNFHWTTVRFEKDIYTCNLTELGDYIASVVRFLLMQKEIVSCEEILEIDI